MENIKHLFYCINSYNTANKTSQRKPCTNRLVFCPTCQVVVWSYNIAIHVKNHHGNEFTGESIVSTEDEAINVLNWEVI